MAASPPSLQKDKTTSGLVRSASLVRTANEVNFAFERGNLAHHSSKHPGPDACKGKRVVVVGSNNSAHDICAALWENDVDVTMVQRSSTCIIRSESLMEIGLGDLYSERAVQSGMTTNKADLIFASLPYRILHQFRPRSTGCIRCIT
jgi:cation diffusion facilitator CzcD-associated flavoprotein CzcO